MTDQGDNAPVQPMSVPDPAPGGIGGMRRIAPKAQPARTRRRRGLSVLLMKIGLPVIVVLTIGSLGYYWLQSRGSVIDAANTVLPPGDEKAKVTVGDVKFDGKDDKGRPYSITADTASHPDGDDRHISLTKPLADIVLASGAYVALTANDGVLDRDTDIMLLNGDVTLFHDNGLSFQTDSATVNLKEKTAEGSDPVEGQNGDGELISEGFRVSDDGDTILFTGKAYMKIYPKQKGQGG